MIPLKRRKGIRKFDMKKYDGLAYETKDKNFLIALENNFCIYVDAEGNMLRIAPNDERDFAKTWGVTPRPVLIDGLPLCVTYTLMENFLAVKKLQEYQNNECLLSSIEMYNSAMFPGEIIREQVYSRDNQRLYYVEIADNFGVFCSPEYILENDKDEIGSFTERSLKQVKIVLTFI